MCCACAYRLCVLYCIYYCRQKLVLRQPARALYVCGYIKLLILSIWKSMILSLIRFLQAFFQMCTIYKSRICCIWHDLTWQPRLSWWERSRQRDAEKKKMRVTSFYHSFDPGTERIWNSSNFSFILKQDSRALIRVFVLLLLYLSCHRMYFERKYPRLNDQ